ncbi:MAG: TlpA family protein disulfide reductase [bacterium]
MNRISLFVFIGVLVGIFGYIFTMSFVYPEENAPSQSPNTVKQNANRAQRPDTTANDSAPEAIRSNLTERSKTILRENGFRTSITFPDPKKFKLRDIAGDKHRLSDHAGQWVLINFWASWCPPCRNEMPSMQKLYERLDDRNFEILAINLKEPRKTARDFARDYQLSFPVLLDRTGKIGHRYRVSTIPTTWLVSPRGQLIAQLMGPLDWSKPDIVTLFENLTRKNNSVRQQTGT